MISAPITWTTTAADGTTHAESGIVTLRQQADIRVRHRRLIEAAGVAASSALAKLPVNDDELETLKLDEIEHLSAAEAQTIFELQDATIIATLESWTRPEPIPTLATIGDLDPDLYESLAQATRSLGVTVDGHVDFEPSNPASPDFPPAHTPASTDSEADLKGEQESTSTESLPPSGTSAASELPTPA